MSKLEATPAQQKAVMFLTDEHELIERTCEGYYIYIVRVDWEVKYIGKGTKKRFMHPLKGTSSCAEINKAFFDGKFITVQIKDPYTNLSDESAKFFEKAFICDAVRKGAKLFNKVVDSDFEHYTVDNNPLEYQFDPFVDVCVNFESSENLKDRQREVLVDYVFLKEQIEPDFTIDNFFEEIKDDYKREGYQPT